MPYSSAQPTPNKSASVDSWLSLMSGAILLVDDSLTIHYCNQNCAQRLKGSIDTIKGANLNDYIKGLDISRGGKQTISLFNDNYTPLFARIEPRKDLQGTLIELKSWDQEVKDQHLSWTHWNKAILKVQRAIVQLEHCEDINQLFKTAIFLANRILDIDRCAIFLFDEKNKCMTGTWGTSQTGEVVDESYFHESITRASWAPITMHNRDFVASWEDFELRHDNRGVGKGWYAATALFENKVEENAGIKECSNDGKLIGWFVCDNLIEGGELTVITRGMIGLFASGVANAIENFSQRGLNLNHNHDVNSHSEKAEQRLKYLAQLKDLNQQQSHLLEKVVNDPSDSKLKQLLVSSNKPEKIQLYKFFEQLISNFSHQCFEKNIYILNQINQNQIHLADKKRLAFILENLLNLAIGQVEFSDHPQIDIEYLNNQIIIQGNGFLNIDANGLQDERNNFSEIQAVAGLSQQLIQYSNSSQGFTLELLC